MNLGDILKHSAVKDLAGLNKNELVYSESIKGDLFEIRLSSLIHKEAFVECTIPNKNSEEEKNYLRIYFLSMVFNAAIHGMKRMKHTKKKKR
jgi:hypothetical protein